MAGRRGPMASFGRNWPLAAHPGPKTARNQQLSTVGSSGHDSQTLATILGPLPTIFANSRPDQQISAVETGQMSSVETEQMTSVESGQMSSVETGRMSSVETRQM